MNKVQEILQKLDEINSTHSSSSKGEGLSDRGLLSPGGQMTLSVPIHSPSGGNEGKTILVKLLDRKVCHRHLLWYLLFRGITVLEWFLLYQNLESHNKGRRKEYNACLCGVLILSASTRKRLDRWNSHTKPIHKILNAKIPREGSNFAQFETLLDFVISELKIPQKGESKDLLYNVQEVFPRTVKPKLPSRIGVGYKDKGSMAPTDTFVPESDFPLPLEEPFEIEDLTKLWRQILTEFSTSPPRESFGER